VLFYLCNGCQNARTCLRQKTFLVISYVLSSHNFMFLSVHYVIVCICVNELVAYYETFVLESQLVANGPLSVT
jgi:hypothetical protein